jgi:hypothetical protein
MAKPLLTDERWQRIEPLLPPPKPRRFRFPGRKPLTPARRSPKSSSSSRPASTGTTCPAS